MKPYFLHSSLRGIPIPDHGVELDRPELCEDIYACLPEWIIAPAFTYSYCWGKLFDPHYDVSQGCGVLAEYFRTRKGSVRTYDPIFSVSSTHPLPQEFFQAQDIDCFGPQSIWAWLTEQDGQLAFLNCSVNFCTYIHYVEQLCCVPYRYAKIFYGETWDIHFNKFPTAATYFVKPQDDSVVTELNPLFKRLTKTTIDLGRWGILQCVSMRELLEDAKQCLRNQPRFLLAS